MRDLVSHEAERGRRFDAALAVEDRTGVLGAAVDAGGGPSKYTSPAAWSWCAPQLQLDALHQAGVMDEEPLDANRVQPQAVRGGAVVRDHEQSQFDAGRAVISGLVPVNSSVNA